MANCKLICRKCGHSAIVKNRDQYDPQYPVHITSRTKQRGRIQYGNHYKEDGGFCGTIEIIGVPCVCAPDANPFEVESNGSWE